MYVSNHQGSARSGEHRSGRSNRKGSLMKVKTIGTMCAMAALVVMAMAGSASAQSADEVVDAHIKALGGLDAINAIKSLDRSGEANLSGMMGEMSGTTRLVLIPGKKAYTEMETDMFSQKGGYDGETAWSEDMMQGLRKLEGEEADQIMAQLVLDALVGYKSDPSGSTIEKSTDEKVGEADHHVLVLTPAGSDTPLTIYVDKATNLISQTKVTQNSPQMGEMQITISTSDYAEHNGVKLAGKTSIDIADGMMTIEYVYTHTVVNGEIDQTLFSMPSTGQ